MVEAERRAEKQSIALIEKYQKEERMEYKAMEKALANQQEPDFEKVERDLVKRLRTLQRELLDIEILLQDALAIARTKYFEEVR